MSDWIIKAEGLGKKYQIKHQAEGQRYVALRDVISERLKGLLHSSPRRRRPAKGLGEVSKISTTEEFWALKDVSFEIKQGEVIGIIGRNGAGKSTLLKILSRITEPSAGRVTLRGRVASLLEVGTGFHPELTGRENIYLNGGILGMTRASIERKFDEIVAFAEVEKFLDTPVKRYSSGMYVRLAFAVAAHLEPEILIVDEVLAVGDAEFQKKCLGRMEDNANGGRTVLFVSHNMSAVQALCGKTIRLDHGFLHSMGEVESTIREYLVGLRAVEAARPDAETSLGEALWLKRLVFRPTAVPSGTPVDFCVELVPRRPTRLRECALLIYSELGARVAIVDLRQQGMLDISMRNSSLIVEGRLHSLPLVEGDYRVGIYVATEDYHGDFLDLAGLSVIGRTLVGDFVPYPPAHRGFVEIESVSRWIAA